MKKVNPRHGSMQVWPRKRAKKAYARVRSWNTKESGVLGFPGYKVGMTHVMATDTKKTSPSKGEEISVPVTVIECPPVKIYSARFYKEDAYGKKVSTEIVLNKDKNLLRKVYTKKTNEQALEKLNITDFSDVSIIIMTQPSKLGFGKKKPELMEVGLGGSVEDKFAFVKENATKEIKVSDIFKDGDFADAHAVTKGKGTQGPVKRFGVNLRSHKSEKTVRGPGAISGGWVAQAHMMYRVAFAGQMGYHQRVQYNNQILKIGEKPEEVNPKAGFKQYGLVKNDYLLVRGSLQGARKRLITLTKPKRLKVKEPLVAVEEIIQ